MRIFVLCAALAAPLFAQAPLPQPPPAKEVERTNATVIATVDGKPVTLGDVRKMLEADPRLMQFMQQNAQSAIAQMFMLRHLAAEGEKLKLAEQSPLKEQLEQARSAAVASAMVNRERDGYPVTSEQVEEYFKRNRSNYEQVHIKAILIAYKTAVAASGSSPEALKDAAMSALLAANAKKSRTEAEAKSLAEDIVRQLRSGAEFAKLVEQYSDDENSKVQGGEFDWVKPNSAYPEDFRKAVFALKAGEVSDPIKQPSGFYVVRADERKTTPIGDVQDQIIQQLRQDHLSEYMNNLNNRFRPAIQDAEFFARPAAILNGSK